LNEWAEVPLREYVAPQDKPTGLITALTPWRINHSFALPVIRLKLENTTRELQLRAVDPAAWVEPRQEMVGPGPESNPAPGKWLGRGDKEMRLVKNASGEVLLQVNAAGGVRKWTLSDCLSLPGVAAALVDESTFTAGSGYPPETRRWWGVG